MLINQYIKNVDFHNITTTFDNLYKDSKSNKIFTKLVDLISSESNILLAYKNIKESISESMQEKILDFLAESFDYLYFDESEYECTFGRSVFA